MFPKAKQIERKRKDGLVCRHVYANFWPRALEPNLNDPPHEYDKSPFLKIYSLESVFKNLRICGQKRRRLRVDGKCKRRKKISFFEIIRLLVDGVLNR